MIHSKLLTFVLIAFSAFAIENSFAQSELAAEPFTVLVAGGGEYARCGPSRDYYQTDPLRHRQRLQVYMETKDGWLGIKPLSNSYCWIPADTVKLNESEQTGTIIEDRTVVWIGSHSERQSKHQWQVKLAEGELVTIIGQSNRQGPDGTQLWYRIVPPSGEYRWVHRDQVMIEDAVLVSDDETTTIDSTTIDAGSQPTMAMSDANLPAGEETLADAMKRDGLIAIFGFNRRQRTVDVAASPIASTSSSAAKSFAPTPVAGMVGSGLAAQPTRPNIGATIPAVPALNPIQQASFLQNSQQPTGWQGRPELDRSAPDRTTPLRGEPTALAAGISNSTIATPRPEASGHGSGNLTYPTDISAEQIAQVQSQVQGANLDQLVVILSGLMARGASAVETQPIIVAARNLASSSPALTEPANRLADRADQYAQLAMRRQATTLSRQRSVTGIPPTPTAMTGPQSILGAVQSRVPADVTVSGRLVPVYSVRADSPSYALTDTFGRTVAYVASSPGINLRTYINTNVTLSGRQMQHSGLDRPVVVANSAVQKAE